MYLGKGYTVYELKMFLVKNIKNNLLQRLSFYTLMMIPAIILFVEKINSTKFNVDEYQHTYLAWSTAFYHQLQYRDMWDNHGILYTLFNSLVLEIFKPEVGIPALMLERYANLVILVIGFYLLQEIFYQLSSRFYLASLGAWIFAFSTLSFKGIEIRPDNLQCLFLYSALILLFRAFKINSLRLIFFSGFFMSLMLMTNLKSISALFALSIGLLIICFRRGNFNFLTNWVFGLVLGLTIFALVFWSLGIFDDYIKQNIIFNLITTKKYPNTTNIEKVLHFFFHDYYFISLIVMGSIVIFGAEFLWRKNFLKKSFEPNLIILLIFFVCLLSRFTVYIYRLQFDLMYFPLACCVTSYVFWKFFNLEFSRPLKLTLLTICFFAFGFLSFDLIKKSREEKSSHNFYLRILQQRFVDINSFLNDDEYLDYYTIDNCPGFGFWRNSEVLFFKYKNSMLAFEDLEQKEIFGTSYINRLNSKKVRIIIGTPKGIDEIPYTETRDYILKNYKHYGCIWERITPFR